MKPNKKGKRHPLLMYRRTMDRVWKYTPVFGLLLGAAGWWTLLRNTDILGLSSDIWIFAAAVLSLLVSGFGFFARYFAYVQADRSFLKVATPFLHLKISYRRIRSFHPVLVQQLFPPDGSNWTQRNYLQPFYGKTALVAEMSGYPIDPRLLRLFLPKQMFSPQTNGLVVLVPDWMQLSTELDSLHGTWLQLEGIRLRKSQAGL